MAIVALLYWLIPEYGFLPSSKGETVLPPVSPPEQELDRELTAEPVAESLDETVNAEPAEEVPAIQLQGRCEDAKTGASLPGFTVRVRDSSQASETATDIDGGFSMPWSGTRDARIEVLAREGWSRGLSVRDLTEGELNGESELLLLVPTLRRGVLRGSVVDSRTGQALPFLRVQLEGSPELEPSVTDRQGGFSFADELAEGLVELRVYDKRRDGALDLGVHPVEHVIDTAESIELVVDIGPTLFLNPSGTSQLETTEWSARIVERRGAPDLSGRILRGPSGWVLATLQTFVEERAWSWQPTHERSPTWTRYPRVEYEPDSEFAALVQLRSLDGRLVGETPIPTTLGVTAPPIDIRTRPVGTLAGVVTDSDGTPVTSANLWMSNGAETRALGPWRSGSAGEFRISELEPGSYELTVVAPLRPMLSQTIDLRPGEQEHPDLVLLPEDADFSIRGRFECRLSHGPAVVLLELEEEHGRDKRRKLLRRLQSQSTVNSEPPQNNQFLFAGLAGSTYNLRPISISGTHHWIPNEISVTTPASPLLFRCAGTAPSANRRVEAVDSTTKGRIPGQELYLGPAKQPSFTWPESRPVERWYTLPASSPLTWTVWAPGYQPATGNLGDLGNSGSRLPAEVILKRGFGMRLFFRVEAAGVKESPGNASVVPGVKIEVDAARYGMSDHNGEALLQLDRAPERIDLLHSRWQVVRIEAITSNEERLPSLCVWLEPR